MALFTDHCLPHAVTGKYLAPQGFVPLQLGTRGTNWADPRTHLLLNLSSGNCSVSDTLQVMQLDDANILGWPLFLGWHDSTPPPAKSGGASPSSTAPARTPKPC